MFGVLINASFETRYDQISWCHRQKRIRKHIADILDNDLSTRIAYAILAVGEVSDQRAHSMILGGLAAEPAITHLLVVRVIVGVVHLLVVSEGTEEEVQSVDTLGELVAGVREVALAEVEDCIVDRRLVGGVRDPIVVEEVLLQEGQFVRADLECAEDVGFVLLGYGHGRRAGFWGGLRVRGHLGRLS